jgi:hypothetical protein
VQYFASFPSATLGEAAADLTEAFQRDVSPTSFQIWKYTPDNLGVFVMYCDDYFDLICRPVLRIFRLGEHRGPSAAEISRRVSFCAKASGQRAGQDVVSERKANLCSER